MIYLELFFTFFMIGTFTIGGGYAMLSLIHGNVVVKHNWLTDQSFTDIVAISQMTPGPIGINSATYVGYSVLEGMGASNFGCILGSFTATFAVVFPSFIIVYSICKAYAKYKESELFKYVLSYMKPAVVGLIAAALVLLINKNTFIDYKSWIIFAVAFGISWFTKVNPILLIIGGGLVGICIY